jgi:LETM1 and EF-hand domain-containing protein 1, mitochondrial
MKPPPPSESRTLPSSVKAHVISSTSPTPTSTSPSSSLTSNGPEKATSSASEEKTKRISAANAIQTAIEDMRKAAQHGIFTPPPEGAGKMGRGWHQVKELFKFYIRGLKMLWVHRKTVKEIQQRLRDEAVDGKPARMTRWESQFIRTYKQDQIKYVNCYPCYPCCLI